MRPFLAAAALVAAPFTAAGAAHAACWQTTDKPPPVTFTATQAGAPITGRFLEYQGRLCLPDAGGSGQASVDIRTGSIDMGMPEFDKEMRGPLWFDSERWPRAEFRASRVEHLDGNRYRISGELTIRDVTRPFSAEVELNPGSDSLHVAGDVELSRLAFDVGTGEWSDTRWVGDKVTVHLSTTLSPAD
jgi:polyisoprenoid-binding protein YceI